MKQADLNVNIAQMLTTIESWVNINSGSFNAEGLQKLAKVLIQDFAILNAETEIVPLPDFQQLNDKGQPFFAPLGPLLRFWKRPDAPLQVLLVAHMDTVYGPEHPFQQAHFKTANILQGPGVTDMKGGLCVLLHALKAWEESPLAAQLGWELIINPDEEIGSPGSKAILETRAKHHQVGLLFEPAIDEKGNLAGVRKGSGKFTLIVHGKSAHAGRSFKDGHHAIAKMAELITAVHALNDKRESIIVNVGQMSGGEAINMVPAMALCRIDVRVSNEADEVWMLNALNALVAKSNATEGFQVILDGEFGRKPKLIAGKTQLLYERAQDVGQSLGLALDWLPSGGCCDGNNLAAVGLPNIDTLGVSGGKIHSGEEYMLVDSLGTRVQLVFGLLESLVKKPL